MTEAASVRSIDCFVVKVPDPYRFSGAEEAVESVPGTDYFFEPEWDQVYSRRMETLLLKVTSEGGRHGWGEVQAPVVPEVATALVRNLLGPMVLGENALAREKLRERLYGSMNVRGHYQGFMIDAISGLDTALWDLSGKVRGASVSSLLGGRRRRRLPAYVSLPGFDANDLAEQAGEYIDAGFRGVKVFAGRGVETDIRTVKAVREAVGPEPDLMIDAFWSYSEREAARLAEELQRFDVRFLEAPLAPEDCDGHARLVSRSRVPIAIGEPMRTVHEFRRWLEQDALDLAQPDIVRSGLSEGRRIVDLVGAFGKRVAPHFGASLGVGMAATWHLSAWAPQFSVQEHQPTCFEVTNRFVDPGLTCEDGMLVVPDGPGLGIGIDESALDDVVTESYHVKEN